MAVLKDLIVHGASKFINIAQFGNYLYGTSSKFNDTIYTDTLDTKYLTVRNHADIASATIPELESQNITVTGLLDVQGDLHTNSWTNSNIATIAGNFYIAPTIITGVCSESDFNAQPRQAGLLISAIENGSASNGWWQITIFGSNILSSIKYEDQILPNLESDQVDENDSNFNAWSTGSTVMITGSIIKDNVTYPLGTLKGVLGGAISSSSVTITKITDSINNNPSTLQEYGEGAFRYADIQISLYKRKYGDNLYPLGILMSAQGRASKSFIDIYNGANISDEGPLVRQETTASSDYGGLAIPMVRIGNLRGLPNLLTGDFTDDNNCLPKGWGIYTENGYFSGTVVATAGNIGGAEIENNMLKVTSANIVSLDAKTIQNVESLSTLTANMGTLTAGRIQGGSPNMSGFMFIAPEDYGIYIESEDTIYNANKLYYYLNENDEYIPLDTESLNDGDSLDPEITYYEPSVEPIRISDSDNKIDWRLILGSNFGIDRNGILYAENVRLRGSVIASEFRVEQNGTTYISSGIEGITIGSHENFNLLINNEGINFYDEDMKVAYINNNTWFTKQANVLNQLLIGFLNNVTIPGSTEKGYGQWAWAVHQHSSGTNNLYLKWVG